MESLQMANWNDKVVLVTGGSRGLGLAIAEAFARHGAAVTILARDAAQLERALGELRAAAGAGARVASAIADVTRAEQVDAAVQQVVGRHGRLDVLVNCAGRSARGAVLETSAEDFRALLELNFLSVVHATQAAAPQLLLARGHVVNIGSLASKVGARYYGAYPATKHALAAYTQQLRLELGPQGLHVLLVCPGPIARREPDERQGIADANVPSWARQPGGNARIRAIDPRRLAERIVRACERREPELVVPWKARLLFSIAALSPRLGDWLLRRMT
ncbi:MAG: SDR family NAD(P)-dependent oxidoreductase [Pirellulales bacterium]